MKKSISKQLIAIILSVVIIITGLPGIIVVLASQTQEEQLRTAFEEYVASTVRKSDGMSSTYSYAGLKAYLANEGFADVKVNSYIKHSKAGFEIATDTLDGYEDGYLFEPEDGYVSALLTYGEVTVGCIADIPAYTYVNTDIDTVSKDSEFTVQDGVITAYNGDAEILVLNSKVSKDWTIKKPTAVKAIIVKNGQNFTASDSGVFSGTKLPNLKAIRFESAGFAVSGDVKLFGNPDSLSTLPPLTHVGLPVNSVYMLPNHFLKNISTIVVLENSEKVQRVGWQAIFGTSISELSFGREADEIYIDAYALMPTVAVNAGVTPVFNLLHNGKSMSGTGGNDKKFSADSIVYANEKVITLMKGKDSCNNAVYKKDSDNGLFKAAVSVKAKINSMTGIVADRENSIKILGDGLSDTYTVEWDSFNTDNGKVTGLISVGNGTDSVKFDVDKPEQTISDDISAAFEKYVASTVRKSDGMSSTYSDAGLKEYLGKNGYAGVEVKDSYIKHSKAGFEIALNVLDEYKDGYFFKPQDGWVSAILSYNGKNYGCIADIPAYTYKNTDIDTVSMDSEFTVQDGVITAYNGNAEILVLNSKVSKDWTIKNADNVKAIIVKSGQAFAAADSGVFSGTKLPNLKAIRFEKATFAASGDLYLFSGASHLTHVGLPESGAYMIPNHFLENISSVVVLENTESVNRIGWAAISGTGISELTLGVGIDEIYIDGIALRPSSALNVGVTPIFHLKYSGNTMNEIGGNTAKFLSGSIVYSSKTVKELMENKASCNMAVFKTEEESLPVAVKVIKDYLNSLKRVGKNGDDLISKLQVVLKSNSDTENMNIGMSWNNTWTVNGDNVTGTLTVTGANDISVDIGFTCVYGISVTDGQLENVLNNIVPDEDVISSLQFENQIVNELGCESSDIFVRDFFHLRPVRGVKDADGVLVEGRCGYAAALVSVTGSEKVISKTWVIQPEMVDLGKLTVSSDDEFEFRANKAGIMAVSKYNGNAQKLVIPDVGAKISGTWEVANKENVQVIIMNNYAVGFEGDVFKDFPNLKVIIYNSEARNYDSIDQAGTYAPVFSNLPSLGWLVWGSGGRAEYYTSLNNATPNLESLPFPDGDTKQSEGRKFGLSSLAKTKINDVILPSGFNVSGALGKEQQFIQLGTKSDSLCKNWVISQYAVDEYTGSAVKSDVEKAVKEAYGNNDSISTSWASWTESSEDSNVSGTLRLSNGSNYLDVRYSKEDVMIGKGESVSERLEYALDNYPYTNYTTEDDLYEFLTGSLMSKKNCSIEISDFYSYKSIAGIQDSDGIIVPGTDGLITAVVKVVEGSNVTTMYVKQTIEAEIDTINISSVSDESDFTVKNGVLLYYSGLAEKIVIPEGVEEIDMFWMDDNSDGRLAARAVILPSTLKTLPYATFSHMENLVAAYIHDNTVNDPGNDEYAFEYCYRLRYVHLSNGFDQIPAGTFIHCKSLSDVCIPGGVTYIGSMAFNSTSMSNVVIGPNVEEVGSRNFEGGYAASCTRASMDLSADETDTWIDVSSAVVKEIRKIKNMYGYDQYRVFTILNKDLIVGTKAFIGGGLPSMRGSHIRAIEGGWAYDDLVATGYLTDKAPGNFDGGTVEMLNMSLAEAAAYMQQYAGSMVLQNSDDADSVLEKLSGIAELSDGVTVEWKTSFRKTEATTAARGNATGVAVMKTADGDTFEINVNAIINTLIDTDSDEDDDKSNNKVDVGNNDVNSSDNNGGNSSDYYYDNDTSNNNGNSKNDSKKTSIKSVLKTKFKKTMTVLEAYDFFWLLVVLAAVSAVTTGVLLVLLIVPDKSKKTHATGDPERSTGD